MIRVQLCSSADAFLQTIEATAKRITAFYVCNQNDQTLCQDTQSLACSKESKEVRHKAYPDCSISKWLLMVKAGKGFDKTHFHQTLLHNFSNA